MRAALASLLAFAILTLWVPELWPVTVFECGVYGLAAISLWRYRERLLSLPYPVIPLAVAALWGVWQYFGGVTVYGFATQASVLRWASFLAVFLTAYPMVRERGRLEWFRRAMVWFGFAVAVEATLQTFTSGGAVFWLFPTESTGVLMGPILSRNHYAAFIEVVLPMAVYLALRERKDPLLYSGMAAAMFASVVASASRAGTLICLGEVVVVSVLLWAGRRSEGRAVGLNLGIMAALLGVFTLAVGWQTVWERFWAPDPFVDRREFAISSLHMIASRPWTGFGLGTWPDVYPRFAIVDVGAIANQAHCDWLQWAAEGGVVFFAVMLSLLLWCLRPAFRSVWGLGVVGVFVHAAVDYPFSRPALGAWPVLVVAMLAAWQGLDEPRERKRTKSYTSSQNASAG
jgi:hypothetical protein